MRIPGRLFCRLAALACALWTLAPAAHAASAEAEAAVVKRIQKYREETWRWQRLMRASRTPTTRLAERSASGSFRRWVLAHWRREAARARRAALNPPHLAAWLCIHRHEGPWTANTGNGYYGGLQMDAAFQRRYGRDLLRAKGLAHRWRPIEQIWVAERAYQSGRGFHPWPNAARACGLI
jgi:Transglycosylase-like domain